jgi:16S rRNA G966 N2-methylase RsmD
MVERWYKENRTPIMDVSIDKFLNIRNSTRNLTDSEFAIVLPELAKQLENIDFITKYTDNQLKTDWNNLCLWNSNDEYINSTSRIGMKLCEHFFPNFYDIENNKGKSFSNLWTKENLEKILKWNRNSHSTPYLSELKRGIYFSCGLTKNTMFRPQMAKLLCIKYQPKIVLDPCAGWGGRMLGVVASGVEYIAFEPNTKTYEGLINLSKFLGIENRVRIICDNALNMDQYSLPKIDMLLTSPPYFDLEIYTHESTQSIQNTPSYEIWNNVFLSPLIQKSLSYLNDDGVSCWNVGKVAGRNMFDDVNVAHSQMNYAKISSFAVVSSKRPTLQNNNGNAKSNDITEIYKK